MANNQPQTSDKGWSFSFMVVYGANRPYPKNVACCETLQRASDLVSFSRRTLVHGADYFRTLSQLRTSSNWRIIVNV
jgi:hypothetical protein